MNETKNKKEGHEVEAKKDFSKEGARGGERGGGEGQEGEVGDRTGGSARGTGRMEKKKNRRR